MRDLFLRTQQQLRLFFYKMCVTPRVGGLKEKPMFYLLGNIAQMTEEWHSVGTEPPIFFTTLTQSQRDQICATPLDCEIKFFTRDD